VGFSFLSLPGVQVRGSCILFWAVVKEESLLWLAGRIIFEGWNSLVVYGNVLGAEAVSEFTDKSLFKERL